MLLAACSTPTTEVAATDTSMARAEAEAQVSEAQAFAADAQRQIDQAAAAVAEAERVLAEQQAAAAREQALARAARARAARSATTVRPRPAVPDDIWGALGKCESGNNPQAVGGGGRYFGAFQFTPAAWRDGGGTGHPLDHDYATQLRVAQELQRKRGWGQWPHCARRLGLI